MLCYIIKYTNKTHYQGGNHYGNSSWTKHSVPALQTAGQSGGPGWGNGVTVQAISKWETGKANPDLLLLPKLAEYFGVTIDHLFCINEAENMISNESTHLLEHNSNWWAGVSEADMTTTALPNYGFFTPTEDTLCLLGDVRGKAVLELACGSGESLVWMVHGSGQNHTF